MTALKEKYFMWGRDILSHDEPIYEGLKKEMIVVPASLKASFYSGQLLDFNIKIPSLLDIFPPVGIYIGLTLL